LVVNAFILHQLEENFQSDSNDIVPVVCYRYICGVDIAILIK